MNTQLHTDPEHHIYGVRGLVAGPRIVSPETRVRFPSYAPNEFTEPRRDFTVGPQFICASVADLVRKRRTENAEVLVRFQPGAPHLKM